MTERVTEESYNPFNLAHRIGENPMTSDDLTPENLDRIAKALQKDLLPDDDYHAQWCRELGVILKRLIDHFEDGNDVIIQAKLGDQIPRMFEKMMDNVTASAVRPSVSVLRPSATMSASRSRRTPSSSTTRSWSVFVYSGGR